MSKTNTQRFFPFRLRFTEPQVVLEGLATSWNPNANDSVWALAVSSGVVYAGGVFTTMGGNPQSYFAQFGFYRKEKVDFDGDGKTDIAIYRGTNGGWYIIPSSTPGAPYGVGWGGDASDKPVTTNLSSID